MLSLSPCVRENSRTLAPTCWGMWLSTDTAAGEAQTAAISMEQRFDELLVHGILHLMGYDHETSEEEARVMEDKSRELLKLVWNDD